MRSVNATTRSGMTGRKLRNYVASVHFSWSCLGLIVAGCQEPIASVSGSGSPVSNQQTGSTMDQKAIAIARQAIKGIISLQKGSPVTVKREGDDYVVTFVHINPPGTLGADYDAQVTINAATWEVVQVLAGS